MTEFNEDVLVDALLWVEAEAAAGVEGEWRQSVYGYGRPTGEAVTARDGQTYNVVCGTGMCIAGHIAVAAGDRFVTWRNIDPHDALVGQVLTPEGRLEPIEVRALELLGLPDVAFDHPDDPVTEAGSWDLFDGDNDIHAIRRIATRAIRDHAEDPEATLARLGWVEEFIGEDVDA